MGKGTDDKGQRAYYCVWGLCLCVCDLIPLSLAKIIMRRQISSRFSRKKLVTNEKNRQQKSIESQDYAMGTHVWILLDKKWIECEVINDSRMMKNILSGEIFELDSCYGELHPSNENIASDMTYLQHLHEPAILSNLKSRLLARKSYTFMGSILIAVNPFEWLEPVDHEDFCNKKMDPEHPHPFAIAGET
jgi:myosin heavy subunit